jgi:hypothetical protein
MLDRLPRHLPYPHWLLLGTISAVLLAGAAYAAGRQDPGVDYLNQLSAQSQALYGFGHPLGAAISGDFSGPGDQAVELAEGLSARIISDRVGEDADMIALWPNDTEPTDAIVCNEIDGSVAGSPATVQRPSRRRGRDRHDLQPGFVRSGASDGVGGRSSWAKRPARVAGSSRSSTHSRSPVSP